MTLVPSYTHPDPTNIHSICSFLVESQLIHATPIKYTHQNKHMFTQQNYLKRKSNFNSEVKRTIYNSPQIEKFSDF